MLGFITVSDIAELKICATGKAIRSNYNAAHPLPSGDWQVHWHTLEHLADHGLVIRVGRYYHLTLAGETCLTARGSIRSTRIARANQPGNR